MKFTPENLKEDYIKLKNIYNFRRNYNTIKKILTEIKTSSRNGNEGVAIRIRSNDVDKSNIWDKLEKRGFNLSYDMFDSTLYIRWD